MGFGLGDITNPGNINPGSSGDPFFGGQAAEASKDAAALAAEGQAEELAYLQEINAIPQAFLEEAMGQFGGYYGIGYDPVTGKATSIEATMPSQEERIALAESSPLYASIMGGQKAGEEAIARTASATGGLRGGGTTADIAGFNTDLQNQATMAGYNDQLIQEQNQLQGLQAMMGQPTQSTNIANTMSGIGNTLAEGKVAEANARSQGASNMIGLAGTAAAMMSDERLKTNIKKISDTSHPEISMYEWDWLPISGKEGYEDGFIAQEVEKVWPDLVFNAEDGYKRIMKTDIETRLKELN